MRLWRVGEDDLTVNDLTITTLVTSATSASTLDIFTRLMVKRLSTGRKVLGHFFLFCILSETTLFVSCGGFRLIGNCTDSLRQMRVKWNDYGSNDLLDRTGWTADSVN